MLYFANSFCYNVFMVKTSGEVRYDVTFQCPTCGHIDTINMQEFPIDGVVECDECEEELLVEIEEETGPRPYWKRFK